MPRVKAKKMSEIAAAPNQDPVAMAQAYGEIAATCVRFHSVYMFEHPDGDEAAGAALDSRYPETTFRYHLARASQPLRAKR